MAQQTKYCRNCGTQMPLDADFCTNCGQAINGTYNVNQNSSQQDIQSQGAPQTSNSYGSYQPTGDIKGRSLPLSIFLTLITCGIYGIYWQVKLNNETNEITGNTDATTGGMVVLFSIITCGIYEIYWYYKMGQRFKDYYAQRNSSQCSDAAVLYLVLGLVVPGIGGLINFCLIQNNINKIVD